MNNSTVDQIKKEIQLNKEIALQKVLDLISKGVGVQSPEQLHIRGKINCGKNVKFDVNVICFYINFLTLSYFEVEFAMNIYGNISAIFD